MVANDEFFQRKQAAAVLKHGVLERYMTVFAAMTGSASAGGRVHYIDGYAGPGRYEPEDGQTIGSPGSPLLAAGTAARLAAGAAKRDLQCTFIERDENFAADLSAVLQSEWRGGGSYAVKEGEVETHLPAAVAAAGTDPLLIFLDPFGTALGYDLLVQQLQIRSPIAKTEVLLNFNVESIRRIGGRLTEELEEGSAAYDARELTLRRVDGFLGGRSWREVYLTNRNPPGTAGAAATAVAERFRAQLSAATGFKSIDVPIRRRPGHMPLFLLTLFYRHDAAPYQFADAASLANRDWRSYNRQIDLADEIARVDNDNAMFDVSDLIAGVAEQNADAAEAALNAEWVVRVAASIRELLSSRSSIPIAATVAEVYGDAFGVAGEKHLRAAWDVLAAEGTAQPREKSRRMWTQTIIRARR